VRNEHEDPVLLLSLNNLAFHQPERICSHPGYAPNVQQRNCNIKVVRKCISKMENAQVAMGNRELVIEEKWFS